MIVSAPSGETKSLQLYLRDGDYRVETLDEFGGVCLLIETFID